MGKIMVPGQPGQKVHQSPSQTIDGHMVYTCHSKLSRKLRPGISQVQANLAKNVCETLF
jgi:hypothetical protein